MFKKIHIPRNTNLVFDTNIFLIGVNFNIIKNHLYTVPGVLEELRVDRYLGENAIILERIQYAVESGQLTIRMPEDMYREKVLKAATITNDLSFLSEVDINLISLAFEVKEIEQNRVILFTNDYSMENVCLELNIPFSPLGKKGISKIRYRSDRVCPACGEINPIEANACRRCGTKFT